MEMTREYLFPWSNEDRAIPWHVRVALRLSPVPATADKFNLNEFAELDKVQEVAGAYYRRAVAEDAG